MTAEGRVQARQRSPLQAADVLGMIALGATLLSLSYLRSRHRVFWSDEIMGWLVLRQPTLAGMLRLWRVGMDSSGIWYYVFGRPWAALFGASEVSLRLYSACGVVGGAAFLWAGARRFYSLLPVAAAVSFVFASATALRWQLANARTYGWLIFACGWVIYLIACGEAPEHRRPKPMFLLVTLLGYSALAGSHILGIAYVLSFLAVQLFTDALSRRWRPWLYLSAAASLAVVLFSRANLLATAAMGKPSFWTVKPALHDLFSLELLFGARVARTLLLLVLLGLWFLRPRRSRVPVYCLAAVFALLDAAMFLYSRVATSIYADRYLLPFTLVGALVLCELLTQVAEAEAPYGWLRRRLPWVWVAAAAVYFFWPSRQQPGGFPYPDQNGGLMATIPSGYPVVDADFGSFVGMEFYGHPRLAKLIYPADRDLVIYPRSKMDASGFHEMENWKAEGIHAEDVQQTAEILANNPNFVVVSSEAHDAWLQRRVLAEPSLAAVLYGTFPQKPYGDLQIWVVHRRTHL